MTDMQKMFDTRAFEEAFKTVAEYNERFAGIAVEAASKSTDIARNTTQEAIANLREVTTVRKDPADYTKAVTDFMQKQMDLMTRAAQSFGDVTQTAGTETTELASKAGEEMSEKVSANANEAVEKATAAANKAA
ncbi:phasin family protein [Roseivivax sp. CAU 1753]